MAVTSTHILYLNNYSDTEKYNIKQEGEITSVLLYHGKSALTF